MKRFMRFLKGKIGNEKGSLLIISYFVIVVFLGLGAAFLLMVVNDARVAERQRISTIAFHIAEAGIERGLYDLRQDFVNGGSTPSWADSNINGYEAGPDTENYFFMPYPEDSIILNEGTYSVQMKNVAGSTGDIWLRSTGTVNDTSQTIEVSVRMVNLSPWDYAIFAGSGATNSMINGVVDIRGSVLILGNTLEDGAYALDLGGTAEIVGNNYLGLAAELAAKVPPLPIVLYNNENVQTLHATLRVRNGLIGLSGDSSVGQPDVKENNVKETVDGVFVNDGFGGNQGAASVYSDNGVTAGYDLGDAVIFPSLSSPYQTYSTYMAYLKANALVLTDELSAIDPTSNFSYSNTKGSISMDGNGNLSISGIVYIDGNNNLGMSTKGAANRITYTGKGSVVVTGSASINVNLVTAGDNSFPNNILGVMTPNNISFTEANSDVMGVFYAEKMITLSKQTDLVGTIVSNVFNMGTNVPAIYQVPNTVNNLPPGLIGAGSVWYMVVAWMKA